MNEFFASSVYFGVLLSLGTYLFGMWLKKKSGIKMLNPLLTAVVLTIVILSGAIWAEQAWSAFWTWDPKETWALITWILYAIYLHLRMRKKMSGKVMAWFVVIAVPVVLFTFVGVNTLLPGLHSYG